MLWLAFICSLKIIIYRTFLQAMNTLVHCLQVSRNKWVNGVVLHCLRNLLFCRFETIEKTGTWKWTNLLLEIIIRYDPPIIFHLWYKNFNLIIRTTVNYDLINFLNHLSFQINLGIYAKDSSTELSVLVDRSVGGSSIVDGQLELMIHRFILSLSQSPVC